MSQLPIFAQERLAVCHGRSDCRNGDICVPTEEKHPGKAFISHGVLRPELKCPKGLWPEIIRHCPACGRVSVLKVNEVCIYCENKRRLRK